MPVIYYSQYKPVSASVREVNEQEHRLGRELLLLALQDLYGLQIRPQDISIAENGKPCLPMHPSIHFNISHCDGLAVCAVDDEPVGVDAEKVGYFAEILIRKVLSEEEKSFLSSVTHVSAEGSGSDHQEPTADAVAADSAKDLCQEWFYRFWTLKEAYVKRTGIGVDTDLTAFSFQFAGNSVTCSDPSVRCFQAILSSGHIISLCYTGDTKSVRIEQIFL